MPGKSVESGPSERAAFSLTQLCTKHRPVCQIFWDTQLVGLIWLMLETCASEPDDMLIGWDLWIADGVQAFS